MDGKDDRFDRESDRMLFYALQRVANGDQSEDALISLFDTCRYWRKHPENASEMKMRSYPQRRKREPLVSSRIRHMMSKEDWVGLACYFKEWQVQLEV